ncbi:MAG: hypothetical protein P8O06_02435 [Porticoccaceae bacterium]|nr:hypothetical protein [Porticoccaceae bacterium]
MYSAENYFWGWFVYTSGVTSLLCVIWYLMRNLRSAALRHLVIILVAVFLLTPVTAYVDDPHLAPAFFVGFYEGFLAKPSGGFQRGAAPIFALMTFSVIFYAFLRATLKVFKKTP